MSRVACWVLLIFGAVVTTAHAQGPPLSKPIPVTLYPQVPDPPQPQQPEPTEKVTPEQPEKKEAETNAVEEDCPPNPLEERLKPTFEIRGRIETDAILAVQSAQSIATIGDLQNGYGFRRVRLGAQGEIGDVARWVSEVELAGGTVRLKDVFIGLTAFPWVREARVGYFREPFSLEGATSSNYLTFMERSPMNNLDPSRNWGVTGYWWPENERALFALGVFRDGTTTGGQSTRDQDSWALTTRLTHLPVYEPDGPQFRLVHFGLAFSHRSPRNGEVIFNSNPASNLLTVNDNPGSPFLPTITIPANSQQIYNLQFARVVESLTFQAEWYGTAVQQIDAGVVFFHGLYFDASYFLTGEHRGYNTTRGGFSSVKVLRPFISRRGYTGDFGAVEVAARFAFADFRSPNIPPTDRTANGTNSPGGILYQLTLGVNWYLNDYTRVMFNYTAGFPDDIGREPTSAHLFSIRAAIHW